MKFSNETKVGILAIVAIVILVLGFNFLKGTSIFSKPPTLFAKFADIGTLEKSNPVKINGLAVGTVVHVHDVPFPFNVPYPPQQWIFGQPWPMLWNEAMFVQAFLCFNTSFRISLSTPLIRHHDEAFGLMLNTKSAPGLHQ